MSGAPHQARILFAHGARNPGWAEPFALLLDEARAARPDLHWRLAYLELMTPGLADVVAELVAAGVTDIGVVPVFLAPGSHTRTDLPQLLEALRARHPAAHLDVTGGALLESAEVRRAVVQSATASGR